jgi:hypothetical protein
MSNKSLQTFHGVAGFAHLLQFFAVLVLVIQDPGTEWPIVSQGFLRKAGLYYYPLGYLVPAFPALSSINHLVSFATPNGWYGDVLKKQVNPLRWAEYSVSAGVMLWIVATLSGVVEIRSLVSIAILNAGLQYVGYLIEKAKAENATNTKQLLLLGFCIHVAIWVEIFISFYTIIGESDEEPPPAVYTIIIIMFLLFTSFGLLSSLWVFDKVKTFEQLEKGYIILSLVSKTFLTWMVYFGVLRAGENFNTPPSCETKHN